MSQTFTERTRSPFRFDIVGSFLRPQYLLDARDQFEKNEMTREELTAVEDKAIIELIEKQEAAGLKAVTDGEFRRASWHCDFFWGLNGVEETYTEEGSNFAGDNKYGITARLSGKVSGENHPFVDHYKFARAHASDNVEVKQTIPSPAQFVQEVRRAINIDATKAVYDNLEDLVQDTVKAYIQVITDLYEAGAKTVQFDDCTWGRIINGEDHTGKEYTEAEKETLKALYIRLVNEVIAGKPEDLHITTHVCRGNFRSQWFGTGGYDSVATPLFDQGNYEAYYLEYDSDRAGTFEPLSKITDDKYVVLGLVTSKDGRLEDKEEVIERIHEASKYVPLDHLCLGTQCGFSSNAVGNVLTEEDQWNKIALIKEIAEEVWG